MRYILKILAAVAFIALLATAGAGWWFWQGYQKPGTAPEQVIYIAPGSGAQGIAQQFAGAGIVPHPLPFLVIETVLGHIRHYKAGEYLFPAGISPSGASAVLRSGKTYQRKLILVEGQTVAGFLADAASLVGLTGDWPDPVPEGSLLPDTWFYHRGDSRKAVVARMQAAMEEELARLWEQRQPGLPLETQEQALILASIVEKETGQPEERGRVARVFLNRLKAGMPLQSDPTVIYALTDGNGPLERRLLRKDWELDHPYNTYRIPALPPGPICNPGRASLRAVLQPEPGDDLFFVSDGKGGHVFAKTLAEHNRNVAALQKMRQENRSR